MSRKIVMVMKEKGSVVYNNDSMPYDPIALEIKYTSAFVIITTRVPEGILDKAILNEDIKSIKVYR